MSTNEVTPDTQGVEGSLNRDEKYDVASLSHFPKNRELHSTSVQHKIQEIIFNFLDLSLVLVINV